MTEKQKFERLTKKFYHWAYQEWPVWATSLGIHQYDDCLPDYSKKALAQRTATLKRFNHSLSRIEKAKLNFSTQTEYEILKADLGWAIIEEEEVRFFEKNPGLYVDGVVWGVFFLMTRKFAPIKVRAKSLLGRLEKAPRLLEQGKKNLQNPPRVYTEVTLQACEGGLFVLERKVPIFARQAPQLEKQILAANKKAMRAMKAYLAFLKKLLKRSKGKYALGKDLFAKKLALAQGLDYTPEELLDLGWEIFHQTEKDLEKVAQKIDASQSWQAVIKKLRQVRPEPEKLLQTYQEEVRKLKQFLTKKQIVPLPGDEKLKVIETPHSERATTPYAAYLSPAPFENDQTGQFWVTPVDKKLSINEQERQLSEHALDHLPVTVLHESYPGHHLQLVWANRSDSLVRRHSHNTPYCEGWALYCERLMEEVGYLARPEQRFFRLKDKLWRAARVILDVSLHTGGMSVDEAVDFLVEKIHLARPSALTEVRRYTLTPTYPLSYLLGKLEILKLREEMKKRQGKKFNLKDFHRQFLATGTIPLKLARRELLEKLK
jgi:uncharacterized protein (DUF885 family)